MIPDDLSWITELKDSIWSWMSQLFVSDHPGWVRICLKGPLLLPDEGSGLGASCLALKTCAMLGLLERLKPGELEGWVSYIQSFQDGTGRFKGYFLDKAVLRVADKNIGWFRHNIPVRRAETRQACASLLTAGTRPLYPFSHLPQTPRQARKYIRELDWSRPWAAGSHIGHLLFFLEMNRKIFGLTSLADELIPIIFSELEQLQDPETGSWYTKRPIPEQVVNGAMKVLTAYAYMEKPFSYPERLIDTCLTCANDEHACNNADVIYILHQCTRYSSYRKEEILDHMIHRLAIVNKFRRDDGAFSFYNDRAQVCYYDVPISRGLLESDIHGTTLFVWMLAMIGDLLGFNRELGWRLPIT